jgi:beta-galactosidase
LELKALEKLYDVLNINIENYPKGIIVEYRDGFGIALNYSDEAYEMDLPPGTKILVGEKNIPTAGVLVWKL